MIPQILHGEVVDNSNYFYKIEMDGSAPLHLKIMHLRRNEFTFGDNPRIGDKVTLHYMKMASGAYWHGEVYK